MSKKMQNAYKAWPILCRLAKNEGQKIPYSKLAAKVGVTGRMRGRSARYFLDPIQRYCLDNGLPPLTILAVNKSTDRPGEGFIASDLRTFDDQRIEVANFNWNEVENPFVYAAVGTDKATIIKKILAAGEAEAKEIYAKIKVRGAVQSLFKSALLKAYGGKCAFCDLSFPEALEGAHIIPWSQATHEQRIMPSNGILLCANHHKLFDAGLVSLGLKGHIHYRYEIDDSYSDSDRQLTTTIDGRKAYLPKEPHLRPSEKSLSYRHIP